MTLEAQGRCVCHAADCPATHLTASFSTFGLSFSCAGREAAVLPTSLGLFEDRFLGNWLLCSCNRTSLTECMHHWRESRQAGRMTPSRSCVKNRSQLVMNFTTTHYLDTLANVPWGIACQQHMSPSLVGLLSNIEQCYHLDGGSCCMYYWNQCQRNAGTRYPFHTHTIRLSGWSVVCCSCYCYAVCQHYCRTLSAYTLQCLQKFAFWSYCSQVVEQNSVARHYVVHRVAPCLQACNSLLRNLIRIGPASHTTCT